MYEQELIALTSKPPGVITSAGDLRSKTEALALSYAQSVPVQLKLSFTHFSRLFGFGVCPNTDQIRIPGRYFSTRNDISLIYPGLGTQKS